MSQHETNFYSPEQAIEKLRGIIEDEKPTNPKRDLMESISNVLDRVNTKNIGLAQVKAVIKNMLKKHITHNPEADGLPMPYIWRGLIANSTGITDLQVEQALSEFVEEGVVEKIQDGITYYKLVTDNAQTKQKPKGESKK